MRCGCQQGRSLSCCRAATMPSGERCAFPTPIRPSNPDTMQRSRAAKRDACPLLRRQRSQPSPRPVGVNALRDCEGHERHRTGSRRGSSRSRIVSCANLTAFQMASQQRLLRRFPRTPVHSAAGKQTSGSACIERSSLLTVSSFRCSAYLLASRQDTPDAAPRTLQLTAFPVTARPLDALQVE